MNASNVATLTAARPTSAPNGGQESVLVLSLVHPDFLPPLYAVAQVLRDQGLDVHVFSFSTPTGVPMDPGCGVHLYDCGPQVGGPLARARARRRFRRRVAAWREEHRPAIILAACPFSFLQALRVAGRRVPVVYLSYETYDVRARNLLSSPANALRSFRALQRLRDAALICVPSAERAGWLAARGRLRRLPATVLNAPSREAWHADRPSIDPDTAQSLPADLFTRRLVIHTGGVGRTQALEEVIESVTAWPSDAALLVTNVGASPYAARLRACVARSARRRDITLLPSVPRSTMLALQRRAVVGICLLRDDDVPEATMPAPNKVGEYLHAGLLVVAPRVSYFDRLEADGVAVLSNGLTPRAIGVAVCHALDRASEPGWRSRVEQVAESWYCMETQARPILDLLARTDA